MKKVFAAAAAVLSVCLSAQAATPPIASVACTANVTGCAFAADGNVPAQGQFYQTQTAYWSGSADYVTYALSGPVLVSGLLASLDNNDDYRFDVSTNGSTWTTLALITANLGPVNGGMDTFSTQAGSPFFTAGIGFAPTLASFVRITALNGDSLYSVGELTLYTAAVPEPSTPLLLAGGIAVLATLRRRVRTG